MSCLQRFGMAVDPLNDTQPRRAFGGLVLGRSGRNSQTRLRVSLDQLALAGQPQIGSSSSRPSLTRRGSGTDPNEATRATCSG